MKPVTMAKMLTAVDYALSFHLGEEMVYAPEMLPFTDVVSVAQVIDSPDPKLLLTLRDGSQFSLTMCQEQWPEFSQEEAAEILGDTAERERFGDDHGLSSAPDEPYFPE